MTLSVHRLGCMRGDHRLFKGLDVELRAGEALQIVGPNGSGKTSLLRILAGLGLPSEGEVCWQGRNIDREREHYYRQSMYLGHLQAVKDYLLAREDAAFASALAGGRPGRSAALTALQNLGLRRVSRLPVRLLSQGQRKMVALARLRCGAERLLWILDEPFAALDADAVHDVAGLIDAHLENGGMLVYTTHQEAGLNPVRTRRLDLERCIAC